MTKSKEQRAKIKQLCAIFFVLFFLFLPGVDVFAQSSDVQADEPQVGDISSALEGLDQTRGASIPVLFGRATAFLFFGIGMTGMVLFVYGGVLWMTSFGNADKAGKARKILVWTALGMAGIFSSYAMARFVFDAFR